MSAQDPCVTLFDDDDEQHHPDASDPMQCSAPCESPSATYPREISSDLRDKLHSAPSCIDARADGHLAIKCRVTERGGAWRNTVDGARASIAANRKSHAANAKIRSGRPCHLLTFGTGPDTLYWGRYRCVGGGPDRFELERIDDDPEAQALLGQLSPRSGPSYRSRLERAYADRFARSGIDARYEPVTIHLSATRQYTPDFLILSPPHAPLLIEIKGAVVDEELELCGRVSAMGFHVALLFGDASEMCASTCFEFMPYRSEPTRSLPALLRGA